MLISTMEAFGFYNEKQKERLQREMDRYSSYSEFVSGILRGDELEELSVEETERIKRIIESQLRSLNETDSDEINYDDVTLIELS